MTAYHDTLRGEIDRLEKKLTTTKVELYNERATMERMKQDHRQWCETHAAKLQKHIEVQDSMVAEMRKGQEALEIAVHNSQFWQNQAIKNWEKAEQDLQEEGQPPTPQRTMSTQIRAHELIRKHFPSDAPFKVDKKAAVPSDAEDAPSKPWVDKKAAVVKKASLKSPIKAAARKSKAMKAMKA